jgi:hypothetical protein
MMMVIVGTPGRFDDAARQQDREARRAGDSKQMFRVKHGENSRMVRRSSDMAGIIKRNGCDAILIVTATVFGFGEIIELRRV